MRDVQTGDMSRHLIGESPPMAALKARIAAVAPSHAPVLVTGPTGAGKERVAEAVHAASGRGGAHVAINCGALPPDLLEAELFGHERGAFTGAVAQRIGLIEQADGGTLFLDEVGEMPAALQVRLLRVLETKTFTRVGGRVTLASDFRLLAATHRDLRAAVVEGRFREDLLYRIDVLRLEVPCLAARSSDIPDLLAHLAAEAGLPLLRITAAGLETLQRHAWPGNVRELRNVHDRAQVHYRGQDIGAVEVSEALGTEHAAPMAAVQERAQTDLRSVLAETEATLIRRALEEADGTIAGAARRLGLKRTTLLGRMARLGIEAPARP
ncbi:MAG: sigma-54 dependent transcriptional regulator [Pseudomonadota bacterium]